MNQMYAEDEIHDSSETTSEVLSITHITCEATMKTTLSTNKLSTNFLYSNHYSLQRIVV